MVDFCRIASVIFIIISFCDVTGQSHGWTVNPADYGHSGEVTSVVYLGADLVTTGTLGAFVNGVCRGYKDGALFPPNGKTVFILICYSNMSKGEKITFKYFNPSNNLFYDVNETIEFEADMIQGNALTPLEFYSINTSIENVKGDIDEELRFHTYPNPFNQNLNIEYSINEETHVRVAIYDAFGRTIHVLVDQKQPPDHYSIKWDSGLQSCGIYIVKYITGEGQKIQKVILIR